MRLRAFAHVSWHLAQVNEAKVPDDDLSALWRRAADPKGEHEPIPPLRRIPRLTVVMGCGETACRQQLEALATKEAGSARGQASTATLHLRTRSPLVVGGFSVRCAQLSVLHALPCHVSGHRTTPVAVRYMVRF